MDVLLSIKPEHVANIVNGTKRFEFRRKVFSKDVSKVVIYCTKPVGKIVAEFIIERILEGSPEEIWNETREASGISRDFFDSYFDGRDTAFAIEIGALNVFDDPIEPCDVVENFSPPQSYRYLPKLESSKQFEMTV
jgi:predicted transcriptional regulator